MPRRKIMLRENCCFLLFRKSGILCLKNETRLPSGRGEAVGEFEPKLDPFIRYGETPRFYSVRTNCSGETPTEHIVSAVRMHQLKITKRSAVALIAGKPLARKKPNRSCFLCGTNTSLRYDPRKGRHCNTRNRHIAEKPRWIVFSVLYENPK